MKQVVKKLRRTGGFTLTEVLVTLLIFSILTLAILVGTGSAAKVYRKAVLASEAQTLSSTLVQGLSDELRYARNIQTDGAGEVTSFDSATFGPAAAIDSSGDTVKLGQQELLSPGAYTSGLKAKVDVTYDGGVFQMTVTVSDSGGGAIRTVETAVRALNP